MLTMRRVLTTLSVTALCLLAAPAALATTQTAHGGNVSATFTFQGKVPKFHGLHLTISRGGATVYDQPVVAKFCGKLCWPGPVVGGRSAVRVVDLEGTGEPDVVLDLYSGGAHCCTVVQIFSFDPGTATYVKTERVFGDPDAKIVDLGHNGHFEFLTADDSFAYAFTDFAASGLPLQVLNFSGGRFHDVTKAYPALVRKDAALWLKTFKGMSRQHFQDSVGVIAAWAADEYRLGKSAAANRYLSAQAKAGHLNSPLGRSVPQGQRFVAALKKFLRRHGY